MDDGPWGQRRDPAWEAASRKPGCSRFHTETGPGGHRASAQGPHGCGHSVRGCQALSPGLPCPQTERPPCSQGRAQRPGLEGQDPRRGLGPSSVLGRAPRGGAAAWVGRGQGRSRELRNVPGAQAPQARGVASPPRAGPAQEFGISTAGKKVWGSRVQVQEAQARPCTLSI